MCDSESIMLNFEIGILKELHKRQLLTRDELDRAIKNVISDNNGRTKKQP
ncbi:MAG: hypothetical protein LBH62_01170 [Nitrososphaerota archaeon]|jgi:hypothetical protein|nr:hypothetical protein [Candidatus Termiticorpusculum sp.]MCL2257696.1 hypothetical protein [Candidatus Termiticorpusculum sp.]MCL2292179.1 hypothetical protein [Candidatus Termiticorpusculum sp.]MDR0460040.1 hypothetical protein [Nitrososphaerota archaeon]